VVTATAPPVLFDALSGATLAVRGSVPIRRSVVYNIGTGEFLCHEDLKFHNPDELRMVGINEPEKGLESAHGRPYLFLKESRLDDHSDYEDKVREYHKALEDRTLPHLKPKNKGDA